MLLVARQINPLPREQSDCISIQMEAQTIKSEREEASDPQTSAERLSLLARSQEKEVRRAVAQNPNTPFAALYELSFEFTDEFWQNPAQPLFLLENPAFFQSLSLYKRAQLLSSEHVPQGFLEASAQHPVPFIRKAVAALPHCPVRLLIALAHDPEPELRRQVAQHPSVPDAALERLSWDQDPNIRAEAARRPNTPRSSLERLAQDASAKVRAAVAQNPNSPAPLLEALSNDPSLSVREAVAQHPNTSAGILARLATESASLREALTQNPGLPASLLEQLSQDEHWVIRQKMAKRNDLSGALIAFFSRDPSWQVRLAIAERPEALILGRLVQDRRPEVREAALRTLKAAACASEGAETAAPPNLR